MISGLSGGVSGSKSHPKGMLWQSLTTNLERCKKLKELRKWSVRMKSIARARERDEQQLQMGGEAERKRWENNKANTVQVQKTEEERVLNRKKV